MARDFGFDVMKEVKERWSPRAFAEGRIPREELLPLFEAARYAPSCFNEQPWLFVLATEPSGLELLRSFLAPKNRLWADRAPALAVACARTAFSRNGNHNDWAEFDCGTAWGFLALEAQRRGFITHAMAGFDRAAASKGLKLKEGVKPIAMIAIGRYGDKSLLHPDFLPLEEPGSRKPLAEVVVEP